MKEWFVKLRDHHDTIYKGFLFLATVALIVYLFPKEGKFKYEFQKGKPWLHENLIAPFDFAIRKSTEEVTAEQTEIQTQAKAYFIYRAESGTERLKGYASTFETAWQQVNERDSLNQNAEVMPDLRKQVLKDTLFILLEELYKRGVVAPSEQFSVETSGQWVQLIRNNVVEERAYADLYTMKSAYNHLHDLLDKGFQEKGTALLGMVFNDLVSYNVFYDAETTLKVVEEQLSTVSETRGMVQKGEDIISKGNIVDEDKYWKLQSLKSEYEAQLWASSNYTLILLGQIILVTAALLVLFLFLRQHRMFILESSSRVTFILLNILLMVLMATMVIRFGPALLYLAPFTILPIVLRAFFDTRVALFVHLVTVLIIGFLAPNSFEFVFLQLIAGMSVIITVGSMYKRAQLFLSAAKIISIYFVSYFGMAIIQEGSLDQIKLINFAFFAGNGILTLFAYPLIYAFERLFGLVSDVSLLELSDTNTPLLKELAEKAPGTFQHSLQVANLAESAVLAINGNVLLARTGALYHDIGKMDNPLYFIENQVTGVNPHDELAFEESAGMIINHVKKGIEKAKKYKLPDQLIDFIRTHHGTTMVQYFYRQYLKSFPDQIADKSKFSYPGPKPFSKETAVLMMADAVEAASRSLKGPNAEAIDKLVDSIISQQMEEGQFANADITLKEISLIKEMFKKKLINIYHLRVEYPE